MLTDDLEWGQSHLRNHPEHDPQRAAIPQLLLSRETHHLGWICFAPCTVGNLHSRYWFMQGFAEAFCSEILLGKSCTGAVLGWLLWRLPIHLISELCNLGREIGLVGLIVCFCFNRSHVITLGLSSGSNRTIFTFQAWSLWKEDESFCPAYKERAVIKQWLLENDAGSSLSPLIWTFGARSQVAHPRAPSWRSLGATGAAWTMCPGQTLNFISQF